MSITTIKQLGSCVCHVAVFCSGIDGGDVWGRHLVVVSTENINGQLEYITVKPHIL